jgi:RND superfamily putative drug exporter
MQTTGRAVFFSGITVAIGLSSLILTGVSFLASMGLGGVLVPVSGLLVSMTLLPAALGLFGAKVNRLRVIPTRFLRVGENGAWHRLATAVMARPLVSGGAVLVVMLALSFPLTKLALSYGGLANAPKGLQAIQGYIYMKEHFPTTSDPTQVLVQHLGPGTLLAPREVTGIRALENTLRKNPEAVRVVGPAEFIATSGVPSPSQIAQLKGRYLSSDLRTALIDVTPRHEVGTKPSERLVRQFRQAVAPLATGALKGNAIHVGGAAANYIDWDDAIYGKFPLVIAIVLILTYVFLFFAFRSVFLPLKAVLLNLLSVGAAYGALQLVFQRGIGSSVLSFVPEDGVAPWVPVFLFAFLFGLSMDYEVFLISRMRERWLQTGYNRESVAFGLEKTGRLITSAAGIMIIAFLAFLIGHQIQLKEFGFGLLASIALDASLIRIVLVPSIMEIMGRWNWWVPGFLAGFAQGGVAVERTPAEPEKEPAQAG